MHIQEIQTKLNRLPQKDWKSIFDGAQLVIHDDESLTVQSQAIDNIFLSASMIETDSADELKNQALAQVEELLSQYYRKHPLTQKGFYRKALAIIKGHENDFAAAPRQEPNCTLFVEGGEVVAEDQSSPKFLYGVYCELPDNIANGAIPETVQKWLENGDAHETYLEMNVCRYFC
ncbi:MAG: Unknown protein [uncultured Thiotrichaceae bacterium]|uniref:Uncharacterized protein n=1 Tax=uncultured Thiotrichaceae bacterium TaxID=298394 RepID=A0A6S6TK91_9GAMM|nr:MAG: Unknown protein [uncultured Thiotrichaceae bacterium]